HPLAGQGAVHMAQLAQDAWINLPGGSTSALQNRFRNLSLNARRIPPRHQTLPASCRATLPASVRMGDALPRSSLASALPAHDLKFLAMEDPANTPLPLRLVWRRDAMNPVLQTVIDTAQELFG